MIETGFFSKLYILGYSTIIRTIIINVSVLCLKQSARGHQKRSFILKPTRSNRLQSAVVLMNCLLIHICELE